MINCSECLRFTIGTDIENITLIETLKMYEEEK